MRTVSSAPAPELSASSRANATHPELKAIGHLLGQKASLIGLQVTTLAELYPSYRSGAHIPRDTVEASAARNVDRAIRTLTEGVAPPPAGIQEAWVARERTEQGMPVGEMLDAYKKAHRLIRDAFVTSAATVGLDQAATIRAVCLLSDTADAGASQLYAVRQEMETALAHAGQSREEFLRDLVAGSVDAVALRELAPLHGLRLDRPYQVLRALPGSGVDLDALRMQLDAGCWLRGNSGLLAVVDGQVLGVVPRRPDLGAAAATVALGDPQLLSHAAASHRTARRVSDVAVRFGLSGVVEIADLGLRLAIAAEPELAATLIERYLAPLAAEGEFGDLLEESLREYLAHGRQMQKTARRLGIHPNTLKHRIRRFTEITSCDLDDVRTITEVWWALEARRLNDATSD